MSAFLVLEGLDGAGTTTHAGLLCEWLRTRGHTVTPTFEPTDGPIGRIIRQTLSETEDSPSPETLPWLFAADRADHLHREVFPALEQGHVVVSDRYYHSSLAYQSLHIPLDEVHGLNQAFRTPDLTIFLNIDVDCTLKRISSRNQAREYYEHRERLEQIHGQYTRTIELLQGAGEPIEQVNADRPIEDVAKDIQALAVRIGL